MSFIVRVLFCRNLSEILTLAKFLVFCHTAKSVWALHIPFLGQLPDHCCPGYPYIRWTTSYGTPRDKLGNLQKSVTECDHRRGTMRRRSLAMWLWGWCWQWHPLRLSPCHEFVTLSVQLCLQHVDLDVWCDAACRMVCLYFSQCSLLTCAAAVLIVHKSSIISSVSSAFVTLKSSSCLLISKAFW